VEPTTLEILLGVLLTGGFGVCRIRIIPNDRKKQTEELPRLEAVEPGRKLRNTENETR
jgi:hypothetical protein